MFFQSDSSTKNNQEPTRTQIAFKIFCSWQTSSTTATAAVKNGMRSHKTGPNSSFLLWHNDRIMYEERIIRWWNDKVGKRKHLRSAQHSKSLFVITMTKRYPITGELLSQHPVCHENTDSPQRTEEKFWSTLKGGSEKQASSQCWLGKTVSQTAFWFQNGVH